MEFSFDTAPLVPKESPAPVKMDSPATDVPLMEKYFAIYLDFYRKHGKAWARSVKHFEMRRHHPFAQVTREVNSAMRRYLGADKFALYIDTLEYMILREGVLIKNDRNTLDICERTFNDWAI